VDFSAIFQEKRKKTLNIRGSLQFAGKKSPEGDFWGL
jgi:hypothetical protein